MATFEKRILSGSTNGQPVLVAGTSTANATPIHATGTSSSIIDEIWLYAQNDHTADLLLTIEFGGTTSPNNLIRQTIPFRSGLYLVIPGLVLTGTGSAARNINAFCASANLVMLSGYVNRIA